jgi:carbamoyl-phosphate synthase small subunit
MIKDVTTKKAYKWDSSKNQAATLHPNTSAYDGFTELKEYSANAHIVCIDCGVKWNMLRILSLMGCSVTVVPATSRFEEIRKLKPDGVLVSNGPGDPSAVPYLVDLVRQVIDSGLPTFGICFGHQLIGQALGGKTFKLKFGHHGANHPVKDLLTGRVEITSQNHNFCVDYRSLDSRKVEITHMHLNDDTVEGFRHKEKPVFSVQYHPESSPGPSDSRYLFKRFLDMVREARHA